MCTEMWKRTSFGAGVGVVSVALLMAAASGLSGQDRSAAEAGKASVSVQPVERDFRFEVVSIRPAEPPNGREYGAGPIPPSYTPGHYREIKVSLAGLAMQAFGAKHSFEVKYPEWMSSTWFAVNATLPEGAAKADLPIMIRHLLEDRFALKYHHETSQMTGYVLAVAKSGPHLAKPAGPSPNPSTPKGPAIEVKSGVPQFSKDAGSGQLYSGTIAWWRGRNKTMQSLASDLADRLHEPVMDATGLGGEYDYTLTYTPGEEMYAPGYVPPADGAGASTPLEHPLLRDALREQLGLELRPVKNVPIDVVVVDSAKRESTDN
jgi:uncharacterized protein (TIGR03435 family)